MPWWRLAAVAPYMLPPWPAKLDWSYHRAAAPGVVFRPVSRRRISTTTYTQSVVRPMTEGRPAEVNAAFTALEEQARRSDSLTPEDVPTDDAHWRRRSILRYLRPKPRKSPIRWLDVVDVSTMSSANFTALHERSYTYGAAETSQSKLVNVRLRRLGGVDKPPLQPAEGAGKTPEKDWTAPVLLARLSRTSTSPPLPCINCAGR